MSDLSLSHGKVQFLLCWMLCRRLWSTIQVHDSIRWWKRIGIVLTKIISIVILLTCIMAHFEVGCAWVSSVSWCWLVGNHTLFILHWIISMDRHCVWVERHSFGCHSSRNSIPSAVKAIYFFLSQHQHQHHFEHNLLYYDHYTDRYNDDDDSVAAAAAVLSILLEFIGF